VEQLELSNTTGRAIKEYIYCIKLFGSISSTFKCTLYLKPSIFILQYLLKRDEIMYHKMSPTKNVHKHCAHNSEGLEQFNAHLQLNG
jgi:hypothetical protein